ncbi:MAG: hypothetical protein ACK4N5_24690, partial [Myxococcales bacterium]
MPLLALIAACTPPPPDTPAPPAVVPIPGRAPEPLVLHTTDALPPPAPAEAPGMRAVALGADGAWFLDSRRHAAVFAPFDGGPVRAHGDWTGESGLVAVAGGTLLVVDGGDLRAYAAGVPPRTLAAGLGTVQALAADATTAYVATSAWFGAGPDGPDGRVLAVPLDGGPAR